MEASNQATGSGTESPETAVQREFFTFLDSFNEVSENADSNNENESSGQTTRRPYVEQLMKMRDAFRQTMYIDFGHVTRHNTYLANLIKANYYRYAPALKRAIKDLAKLHTSEWVDDDLKEKAFHISIIGLDAVHRLRDMKTDKISQLTSFSATVTRTSEVKPELVVGAFQCKLCGEYIKDVEQQSHYTMPSICLNGQCNNKLEWRLDKDSCTFVDWQRARVQENSEEVPAGSLPRTMEVILRAEQVERARAGDKCTFTGCLQVVPEAPPKTVAGQRIQEFSEPTRGTTNASSEGVGGLRSLGARELHHRLVYIATNVAGSTANVGTDGEEAEEVTSEEQEEIDTMQADPQIFNNLVSSIAPAVHGHEDIKRAILLMLIGGVHKDTAEGIGLRGDVNIAIIGDPSCAKSQFLKYVASFMPRAVYTSGKSSSAAGLTATVVKDGESGEHSIEAGALMLADNGICCIDEFDKMDPNDQVAIHEAMEQQTISISKAGINASLNARTSILAAANPIGGRYDKSKPLRLNVNLQAPILSRFDLILMMLDEPDEEADSAIARHLVDLHAHMSEAVHPPYSKQRLQTYIKAAKRVRPVFTDIAQEDMIAAYVNLRSGDAAPGSKSAYRITVRQLEALVRLAEAVARIHISRLVLPSHVREAKRLLRTSIITLDHRDVSVSIGADDEEDIADKDYSAILAEEARRRRGTEDGDEHARSGNENNDESYCAEDDDGGQGQQQRQQQLQPTRFSVSYETYQHTKNLLCRRLMEAEDPNQQREGGSEGADGIGGGGMREGELLSWFIGNQREQGVIGGDDDVRRQYKEVMAITRKLIKEGTLVITQEPPVEAEDATPASRAERRLERYLALNSNFTFDD